MTLASNVSTGSSGVDEPSSVQAENSMAEKRAQMSEMLICLFIGELTDE
jgi:hypothetical protein